ncbi:MAG: hypothetical protein BECKG1743D_GA0114223_103742 [Candidatus Kentron sp. G]|nr:MAG: hypothetical protein BECKG1743F_GA0114225_104452 [Candidatus Kentron sp. G]VFN00988.1 MAG: hypothetical protein BECKG1743E_GA0114224_103692 [Candidatus Kentron sp. G]VFN02530.1 MAG: hypothetical protein BECKG1743D_GA0114223_103742 [Candidatus Kentron sp. G]
MRKSRKPALCLALILCIQVGITHAAAQNKTITAIPGIGAGHYEDRDALRGVRVIRFLSEQRAEVVPRTAKF